MALRQTTAGLLLSRPHLHKQFSKQTAPQQKYASVYQVKVSVCKNNIYGINRYIHTLYYHQTKKLSSIKNL